MPRSCWPRRGDRSKKRRPANFSFRQRRTPPAATRPALPATALDVATMPLRSLNEMDVIILFGMDKIILSGTCEMLVGAGRKGYFQKPSRAGWPGGYDEQRLSGSIMGNRPETIDYHQPRPHPDGWQWRRALDWLTAGCFAAGIYCGVMTYLLYNSLAVPRPWFELRTTYVSLGLIAAGVALVFVSVRLRRRAG